MPAPSSYTESSLLAFMETEVGPVGEALGLLTSDALQNGVYAVERLLGVSDVAAATNMALLEAAARWEAWRAAEAAAVGQYDLKAGSSTLTRSQTFDHIQARLAQAEREYYIALSAADAANGITVFMFATVPGCRGR